MNLFKRATTVISTTLKGTFPSVAKHYKTMNECIDTYQEEVIHSGISAKTIQNRLSYINKIRMSIGNKRIRQLGKFKFVKSIKK